MGAEPKISNPSESLRRTTMRCQGDICECLAQKIDELANNETTHASGTKGLGQLAREQTQAGAAGPGSDTWNVHDQKYRSQRDNLRQHIAEYDANGCGGTPGLPANARALARAPAPSADDWRANNPAYQGVTGSAAGDLAGGALLLYGGYRVIRMIPSLWPPAWWTIPANLATP